jgi:hypothetical protein
MAKAKEYLIIIVPLLLFGAVYLMFSMCYGLNPRVWEEGVKGVFLFSQVIMFAFSTLAVVKYIIEIGD